MNLEMRSRQSWTLQLISGSWGCCVDWTTRGVTRGWKRGVACYVRAEDECMREGNWYTKTRAIFSIKTEDLKQWCVPALGRRALRCWPRKQSREAEAGAGDRWPGVQTQCSGGRWAGWQMTGEQEMKAGGRDPVLWESHHHYPPPSFSLTLSLSLS